MDQLPAPLQGDPEKLSKLHMRLSSRSDSLSALNLSPTNAEAASAVLLEHGRARDEALDAPLLGDEGEAGRKRARKDDSGALASPEPREALPPTASAAAPGALERQSSTGSSSARAGQGSKQVSIKALFTQPSPQAMAQASAQALLDLQAARREADEAKRRSVEVLDALRSAHERAELAERETELERRRYKKELVMQLKLQAKAEFEEARRNVASACLKYGTVKWDRSGNVVKEVWQNGSAFEELKAQETELAEEEKSLLAFKADIKVRKRKAPAYDVNEPGISKVELDEQEEIYNLQLVSVRKRMDDVKTAFDALTIQTGLHRKEMKRVRDEDESRFKHGCLLDDRFVLMKLVGKGGFSEVFKAYDVTLLKYVAVKLHQLQTNWNMNKKDSYVKHAQRELDIQQNVRHPRVVSVFHSFGIDENAWASVMDYCEGRDLDFHLKLHHCLPEKEAKSILLQILRALHYLHTRPKPVIHFDLKPGNVLFHNSEIRLTDFGLSKVMEDTAVGESQMELTSQGAGTYWYLPPECFVQGAGARISPKVDVWSLGVVFYQILYGKRPFGDDMSQQSILEKSLINNHSVVAFPAKPVVSEGCKQILSAMLTADVRLRPTVEEVLAHAYLQKKVAASKSKPGTFKEPLPPTAAK